MMRIERLAAILLLLQEKTRTSQEIARRFEISRRTVLRDIQALCEMGVPVIAREGPSGGYWLPDNYRFDPLPLNGREAFLLLLALKSLENLSELPFRNELASLVVKLRAGLSADEIDGVEGLLQTVEVSSPARPQRAPFLEKLLEALDENRWLYITYQSSERVSSQHILPEQVSIQDGLWYCRAFSAERSGQRTFRVDRILTVELPAAEFVPPVVEPALPYDHESHPLVLARLTRLGADRAEFDRAIGPRLHRMPDGGAELAFRCPPDEIEYYARFFAGLGEDVEVFAPDELRSRLAVIGQKMVDKYA
jgi:predicted DNA-binding transcriptional regulator YafY